MYFFLLMVIVLDPDRVGRQGWSQYQLRESPLSPLYLKSDVLTF